MHAWVYTSQIHYRHTSINRCSRLRWDFKTQKGGKNLQKCWSLLSSSETNAGKLKALKRDGRESSQQRINWWTKVYLWHSPGPKVESNCELKSIGWRVLVSPHFRHFQCSHPAHSATSGSLSVLFIALEHLDKNQVLCENWTTDHFVTMTITQILWLNVTSSKACSPERHSYVVTAADAF